MNKKGGGVKFQDQQQQQQNQQNKGNANENSEYKIPITYKSAKQCKEIAFNTFSNIDTQFKIYTNNDPKVLRKDTASAIKSLLESLKDLLDQLNLGNYEDKNQNYFLTYNATIYLFDMCRFLRKSVYSSIAIDYLAQAIVSLEGNIVLQTVKYLDWKVKIYVELAHVYEECGSLQAANKVLERCYKKIIEAKELEEKDPPLPEYMEKIFTSNIRTVVALECKYKLQNGILQPDAWKKKIEETFPNDYTGRLYAFMESLRIQHPQQQNTLIKKNLQWKQQAVEIVYDYYKNDAETITKALEQTYQKMERQVDYSKTASYLQEDQRNELITKNREQDGEMIKEKVWKLCSQKFPLEYHVELMHSALEVSNYQIFEELSEFAVVRQKYRRIEVPYINDIDLKYSENMYPNRNNGFDCDFVDLNQASLKAELKKLRNQNKSKKSEADDKNKTQKKETKKDAKQPPKKGVTKQEEEVDTSEFQIDGGVGATMEELQQIDHRYVYLTLKKSSNPKNAIYGLDIAMQQEKERNPEYWEQVTGQVKKKEIPVNQYTGVRETTHKTAWMFIKQTLTELIHDEEKQNIIVDIKALFGRNPIIRPDQGYIKIPLDLRQTPKEFIRSPNIEYVYITYKTDKEFFNNEREIDILIALHELEKSYQAEKVQNLESEKRVQIDQVYNIDLLLNLVKIIRTRLDGQLGEQFYEDRKEFLVNLCQLLWNKYIRSQLYQKEYLYELKTSKEISDEQFYEFLEFINHANFVYQEALKVFNLIFMRNPETDIIWLCKLNLELCKLLEDHEEYKQCVQNLRFCLGRIHHYRDSKIERGVESQCDLFLPFSITCNNLKISDMVKQMKESYVESKNKINEEIRIKKRIRKQELEGKRKITLLEEDELQEEEWENLEAQNIHLNDDNKDSNYFKGIEQNIQWRETEMIINSLHADIVINLFRNEIKAGKQIQKANFTKSKVMQSMKEEKSEIYMTASQSKRLMQIPLGENLDGIADKDKIKTTLISGQTAKQIKKNHQTLQNTLITEGKLDPPNPNITNYEQILIEETCSNPYYNALLYMMIAANKTKEPDQFTLLQQAYEFILEAEAIEDLHIQNGIKDSIFALSTLLDNKETQQSSMYNFPFDQLYKAKMIKKTKLPRTPILISRTSTSITFKLPPFYPVIYTPGSTAKDPNKEKIINMAIFGKVSQNRTNVSVTNTDLHNTGVRQKIGSCVTIKNLLRNQKYCFAVGGYDYNEELSNDNVGETSEDVMCLHPLPLTQISSYLAKIAYQIGDYKRAEVAADFVFKYFTEKSEYLDRHLDYEENYIYFLRLKQKAISSVSIIEIQNLTESFLVKARCLKRKYFIVTDGDQTSFKKKAGEIMIQHQKNILTVSNFLLMGIETALCTNSFIMAKKLGTELFNLLGELLNMKRRTTYVFHLLLKCQMMINTIPQQYWDANLRILSAKNTYEITKLSFQFNEANLGKRNMYSQTTSFNRKWYTFSKIIMVPEEPIEKKEDKKAGKKDAKKPAKKVEEIPNEQKEDVKLIPQLIRELHENPTSVQSYLEETLLSFPEDYLDYVQRFVESWKKQIEYFLPFVENPQEEKDNMLNQLSEQMEFWSSLRDINTGYQKIQASYKGSPLYMEIICRLCKRLLEHGTQADYIYSCIEQFTEIPSSESTKVLQEIISLKQQAIENDIDWFPNMLGELIFELETNKTGNEKAIDIFKQYFQKEKEIKNNLKQENYLTPKTSQYLYLNMFFSELYFLKAVSFQLMKIPNSISKEQTPDVYFQVKQISKHKIQEELDQKEKWDNQKDQGLNETLNQVLEFVQQAAVYAVQGKCWLQLQNIIKFLYNLLVFQMMNPFLHQGTDAWKHLSMICLCILDLLKHVKQEGIYPLRQLRRKEISIRPENRNANNQDQNENEQGQITQKVQFQDQNQQNQEQQGDDEYPKQLPVLLSNYTKDVWFTKYKELDTELLANVVAYTVQSLMVEQKWNVLISISRDFCNLTDHFYSSYLLPFTIHAQEILYSEARQRTDDKRDELEKRTKAFEEWKQKNKRKKTRQDQLTGAIPQEQQDYEADKLVLENQISLLTNKENFINSEKELSIQVIQDINRDANQALKDLGEARQQALAVGNEDKSIREDILQIPEAIEATGNIKQKKNVVKTQGQTCINKQYKAVIDLLTKRQEKFANAQAKKELGNLNYVVNYHAQPLTYQTQIATSEESWNEVIDLIFSQHTSLKNYRKILNQMPINTIAHTLGSRSILISINVLSNLSFISYFRDQHLAREAIQFAASLCFSLFKISLPHPQILMKYGSYRMAEISLMEDLFQDRYAVDETETMLACEKIAWQLIDQDMSLKALPMICLMDHIATDLTKSTFYSMRAKIIKAIALANCGQMNESYNLLQKAFQEKDLPNQWCKDSEYIKNQKGINWYYQGKQFNNNIHPNEEQNKEITEEILNKMQLVQDFANKYGHLNYNLFNFAKGLLVFMINKNEIFESQEINDIRQQFLKSNEEQLREILKKISFEEEQEYLAFKLQRNTDQDEIQEQIKQEMEYQFTQKGLNPQEAEEYFQNREENLDYYSKKMERHQMIARIRFLLHQINAAQNIYHRSYYIIKYGLINLIRYSQEQRMQETGLEPEVEAIDNLRPTEETGKGGKGGKKEAAPPKKEEKKGGKQPDKGGDQKTGEEKLKLEQQMKENLIQDIKENKKILEAGKVRRHLSAFWILKLLTEMCDILFKQNKYDEAQQLIEEIVKPECKTYRDNYFLRLVLEIQAKIAIKKGQWENSTKLFDECITLAKTYHQVDAKYCKLLGDYAEILLERQHFEQASNYFQNALKIAEQLLGEISYDPYAQNHYKKCFEENIQVCQEMLTTQEQEEEILTKNEIITTQIGGKGNKKDDKKGKDDKKKDKKPAKGGQQQEEQKAEMPVQQLNQIQDVDFLNRQQKDTYQQIELEKTNNTKLVYNLYVNNVVLYIRCALRWINSIIINQKIGTTTLVTYEALFKLLNKVDKMRDLSKNFIVPISLRLELSCMFAQLNKSKFEHHLQEIQNKYIQKFMDGRKSQDDDVKDKAMKYEKLYSRKPYRDFARNRYLKDVPNFSQQLKENLIPLLDEAKKHYEAAISLFSRGEALWFENNRNIEDLFVELTEIYLYKREYTPRVEYKYINDEEYQEYIEFKKENQPELKDVPVKSHIETLTNTEKSDNSKAENDSFKNIVYAVEVSKLKLDLKMDFQNISAQALQDVSKIPIDIYYDIIEQDYLFKKGYEEIIQYPLIPDQKIELFDEEKKKITVSTIDLLMLILKYYNDSKIMTFTYENIQNKLSKLHRYLKKYLPIYSQRCILPHIESLGIVDKGHMVIKSLQMKSTEEYKLIYVLSGLDKSKIKTTLEEEQINKIIVNEEDKIVYGNIYISAKEMDNLYQQCLNLKSKMMETNKCSEQVKERDYIEYRQMFRSIIEDFGAFFLQTDIPSRKKKMEQQNQKAQDDFVKAGDEQQESLVLKKYTPFIPELNLETIEIFIRIFSQKGLSTININQNQQTQQTQAAPAKAAKGKQPAKEEEDPNANKDGWNSSSVQQNNNVLSIFRYLHSQKYR